MIYRSCTGNCLKPWIIQGLQTCQVAQHPTQVVSSSSRELARRPGSYRWIRHDASCLSTGFFCGCDYHRPFISSSADTSRPGCSYVYSLFFVTSHLVLGILLGRLT